MSFTTMVLDFTGFHLGNDFIIKEFCKARIFKNVLQTVDPPFLVDTTALPISSEALLRSQEFRDFFNKCHIPWYERSGHIGNDLYLRLKSFLGLTCEIYVRDRKHAELLAQYLGIKYQPFKLLTDLGFNMNLEILSTSCQNHSIRASYCVKDNVENMAKWLIRKMDSLSATSDRFAAVSFTGYQNLAGKFLIKEFGIACSDAVGGQVYKEVIVSILPDLKKASAEEKKHYIDNYYDKFGIMWDAGNYKTFTLIRKIVMILVNLRVKRIYVRNPEQMNILRTIIGSSFEIFCLDDDWHAETDPRSRSSCGYHSHAIMDKNVCVNDEILGMIEWILRRN